MSNSYFAALAMALCLSLPGGEKPQLETFEDVLSEVAWKRDTFELARRLGSKKHFQAEMLKALNHSDAEVRNFCARAFSHAPDPDEKIVATLAEAYDREKVDTVRESLVLALGNSKRPDALPALIKALDDSSSVVRRWAVEQLFTTGGDRATILAALIRALKVEQDFLYGSLQTKLTGAFLRSMPGDEQHADALTDAALTAKYPGGRALALQILGRLKIPIEQKIPAMRAGLRDDGIAVRRAACDVAKEHAPVAELLPLLRVLLEDKSISVRAHACGALAKYNDDPEPILRALRAIVQEQSDLHPNLRKAFEESLKAVALLGPKAVPLAGELLALGPEFRQAENILNAFESMGEAFRPHTPALVAWLERGDSDIRFQVLQVFEVAGIEKQCIPALKTAAERNEKYSRSTVRRILEKNPSVESKALLEIVKKKGEQD